MLKDGKLALGHSRRNVSRLFKFVFMFAALWPVVRTISATFPFSGAFAGSGRAALLLCGVVPLE
jgi:hypothetical protein